MDSLGEYLKTVRESQNLTLGKVSESTKIREPLLRAIESDRYDLLSGPFYVKGFLETYARYLGLDSGEVILRYQKSLEGMPVPKVQGLERRITSNKRRVSFWLLLVFAVVLSLGVSIFFFSFNPLEHFFSSFEKEAPTFGSLPSQPSPPSVQSEEDTQSAGLSGKGEISS